MVMKVRAETEMMELILSFARRDERIRAVGMEGSRPGSRRLCCGEVGIYLSGLRREGNRLSSSVAGLGNWFPNDQRGFAVDQKD